MKKITQIIVAVLFMVPLSLMASENSEEPAKATKFSLSEDSSSLKWKGEKPGGEHYGIIKVLSGSIDSDGVSITGGSFVIDMNSILCEDLSNKMFNKKLVGHLKSEDFFHTEEFPEAFFKINKVVAKQSEMEGFKATHLLTGNLTLRGVTKEISFPANVRFDGSKVFASTSEIVLDRTQWNVNHMSKNVFSDLKDKYVNDEMIVSLDLLFENK